MLIEVVTSEVEGFSWRYRSRGNRANILHGFCAKLTKRIQALGVGYTFLKRNVCQVLSSARNNAQYKFRFIVWLGMSFVNQCKYTLSVRFFCLFSCLVSRRYVNYDYRFIACFHIFHGIRHEIFHTQGNNVDRQPDRQRMSGISAQVPPRNVSNPSMFVRNYMLLLLCPLQ